MKLTKQPTQVASLTLIVQAIAALTVGGAAFAGANDTPQSSPNAVGSDQSPASPQNVRSARELIGQEVKGSSGEALGTLKDFVIDTESGRVVYTVVSSGGVLGIGETVRAVPFSALRTLGGDPKDPALQVDQAEWDQTPKLREEQLIALMEGQTEQKFSRVYAEDGPSAARPRLEQASERPDQDASNRPGAEGWMLASKITGKNLRSAGEKLGEVEDVIIDFPHQMAAVLLTQDRTGALTRTDEKFVVPFHQLKATARDRDTWITTLAQVDLDRAQPLNSDLALTSSMELYRWSGPTPSSSERGQALAVAPGAGGSRDRWATVSDDRSANIHDPAAVQTGVLPPVNPDPPVSAVLYALRSDPALSDSAKDVEVTAEKNRLILRGSVASPSIKDEVAARAKEASQGYPLDNQIQVLGEK